MRLDVTDNKQMAKLGAYFKVDKIIVGSVNKFDNYAIEIRSIDVKTGTVDLSVPFEAETEYEIYKTTNKIAQTIERHYMGYDRVSGTFDLSVTPCFVYPFGSLGKGVSYGLGANISGSFNNVFIDNFNLVLLTGACTFLPENKRIKSLYTFPLELAIAYRLPLTKTLTLTPSIGAGVIYSRIQNDKDRLKINGQYDYDTKQYINSVIDVRADFSLFIHDRWFLVIAPSLGLMPGGKYSLLAGLNLGIKTIF